MSRSTFSGKSAGTYGLVSAISLSKSLTAWSMLCLETTLRVLRAAVWRAMMHTSFSHVEDSTRQVHGGRDLCRPLAHRISFILCLKCCRCYDSRHPRSRLTAGTEPSIVP